MADEVERTPRIHFDTAITALKEGIEAFNPGDPEYMAGLDYLDLATQRHKVNNLAHRRLQLKPSSRPIPETLQIEWDLSVARLAQAEGRIHERTTGPSGEAYVTALRNHDGNYKKAIVAARDEGSTDPSGSVVKGTEEILLKAYPFYKTTYYRD